MNAYVFAQKLMVFSLLFFSQLSLAEVLISNEKKMMVDELSLVQGDRLLSQQMSDSMTREIEQIFELNKIDVEEDFFETYSRIAQETIEEEFVSAGELQRLNHSIWGESFSVEELRGLIDFYKTPLGNKLISAMPEITEKTLNAIVNLQERIWPVIYARLSLEMGYSEDYFTNLMAGRVADSEAPEQGGGPLTVELKELQQKLCSEEDIETKRKSVFRGQPIYPALAQIYGVEGWVDVEFRVEEDGRTSNRVVTKSSTGSLFDEGALAAVATHLYCPGKEAKTRKVRIRFELEDSSFSGNFVGSEGKKFEFVNSRQFRDSLAKYAEKDSRKSFAIADDGGEQWVSAWRYGHRYQEDANKAVLKDCLRQKINLKLRSKCAIVFEGQQLVDSFRSNSNLVKFEKKSARTDYEEVSVYEDMEIKYEKFGQAKSLAIAENPSGAFYFYYSKNYPTQEEAINKSLENCNKNKPDYIGGECYTLKVGDYSPESLPKLESIKGLWIGTIETRKVRDDEEVVPETITLNNCGEFPRILTEYEGEDSPQEFARILTVSEDAGNAVLSSVESSEFWAESQVWLVSKLSEDSAVLHWTRQVHNLQLDLEEENKEFGYLGFGKLTRNHHGCDALTEQAKTGD